MAGAGMLPQRAGSVVPRHTHSARRRWGHDDAGSSTAGVSRGNMVAISRARASGISGERMTISLKVNGSQRSVSADADTPLLYVLRNDLALNGAKFGCGLAQCGACTVLLDGRAVRSCITEIGTIGEAEITTIEGLGTVDKPHPLQQAFIDAQAAQCGYCISGMIMTAKDLLDQNPHPSAAEVREALAQNLCRCGTHNRIVRAVLRAAQNLGKT
jgi:nicotinate dehydrogenase subunit A